MKTEKVVDEDKNKQLYVDDICVRVRRQNKEWRKGKKRNKK
jgi:hypothetical protein